MHKRTTPKTFSRAKQLHRNMSPAEVEQKEYDDERTEFLETRGYKVLRFWNNDVMNKIDDVLQVIWSLLQEKER